MARGKRRTARAADLVDALREEVETLREDNARLRLEQQRASSTGRAAAQIRDVVAATVGCLGSSFDDAVASGDDVAAVVQALAEAEVARTALVAICDELLTSVGHLHECLVTRAPAAEIDRRVRDRRAARPAVDILRPVPSPPRHDRVDVVAERRVAQGNGL